MTLNPTFPGVLFGAAYYAEYQEEGTLERDLDLMVEAGFTVIRVGESVWSTWEPRNGEFDLDWLQPVLDAAHERGIAVILGTPTYAIPPWLQTLHPEIASVDAQGHAHGWGARQEMDQSVPVYRWYAERIIRKVVVRYADHPAVIGYQVDNEPGNNLPHNESTFQAFVAWLRRRYGTVERLNEEWGLVYWSHRIAEWSELWRPGGNLMPQYQLEWRRFQGEQATDLIAWQAGIVREYARDDQFVTTCISYSRPQISDDQLAASLDITAGNPYYLMQDGLSADVDLPRRADWWHTGPWALLQWADRAYSSRQERFLVTETNAQSIGGPWQNQPPYPGQIKQAALALVARGSRMVEYWHWHTLHFGVETYWGGVLPHSQVPGRIYREVAELGASLKRLGSALDGFEPDADVLMLHSTDTTWSFEFYPPLATDEGEADRRSYARIVDAFYRGFSEAGAQVRVQHTRQFVEHSAVDLVKRYPVLVAAAEYVADDAVLDALRAYAEAGGHLVLGIRTGYGDELARARRGVAPDRLHDAAGVWYDEYSNLAEPLDVTAAGGFALEPGSQATAWVDVLHPEGAETVVSYRPTELGAEAAVTTAAFGAGRVTYVGTVPNEPFARSLARWLVPDTAAATWRTDRPVTVSTGRTSAGRLVFLHNWSAAEHVVTVPADAVHVETGERFAAGSTYSLEPRGVAVFEVADSHA
ncbi:beta-galactosidase [Leifsonia sp. F6_8S_P_1B]|uniref:Beta-galactosidase n=1 Tax=Leifsonia williamsii TaxID=3035919 RepID=A0ABT8K725_9MICO|nr:beta-galactosidase [Leifsonia williamsii]MDN4612832.1 beta-galactosidase [Leifsonia williamsii]